MNVHKRQSIQKLVIDQAGQDTLILNDLILGYQGAQTVAELIPQYHNQLQHLQIKGNNIDADGFEVIAMSLMHCPQLKSILAQWNSIGSGPSGIAALGHLVKNLQFLELIDLKNNRISHQLSQYLADIIKINNRSLKAIDLRWNQIGQLGFQVIYNALAYNSALKYVGLQDNRISTSSLKKIEIMLSNVARGLNQQNGRTRNFDPRAMTMTMNHSLSHNQLNRPNKTLDYFPISDDSYPSMDVQVKNGQLRNKIQTQQNQAQIYHNKLKLQVDKVLQKIKLKGLQMTQLQIKYDTLNNQNLNLINQLRQSERLLTIQKEGYMGTDKGLNQQKSKLRTQKYNLNLKIQSMMEKNIQRNQRQLQELDNIMSDKMSRLQAYYKERLNQKRSYREKLTDLKEDILKLKMSKQSSWDKITQMTKTAQSKNIQQQYLQLQQVIAKAEFDLKSEQKRSAYLQQQLSKFVLKGLQRQEKTQNDIFDTQNQIKDMHNQMAMANVDIQQNQSRAALLQSQIIDYQSQVEMRRRYVKYIQSQSNVNNQIERLKIQEDEKGQRLVNQTLELRIGQLEKAIRLQQGQNKMIRNQYDKLLSQVQSMAKRTIQQVIFQN